MPNTPTYTSPLALEGWNYIRYLGPFASPQTEPMFLCVRRGELVVAENREPSKLWHVSRLRAEEDDVNRHACSFKREGTQDYIAYRFPPPERNGEVVIGPQARFDVFRVNPMRKPCLIKVYQDPCAPEEQSCEGGSGDSTEPAVDDAPMETDTTVDDTLSKTAEEPAKPPLDWYLGVSEDLKVVLKSFPPPSEGHDQSGVADDRPVWELTTRDEAIDEDNPPVAAPPLRDPRAANNPMRTEYYTRPDRFEMYERSFRPSRSRPY